MTRPSPPFLFTPLYLSGHPGRCGAAAGTRGSRLASPLPPVFGTRRSPLLPDQVARFLPHPPPSGSVFAGEEAQFVAYYPIRKCPLKSMNSFIGLNFDNTGEWGRRSRQACVCWGGGLGTRVGGFGGNTEKSGPRRKGGMQLAQASIIRRHLREGAPTDPYSFA